MNKIISVFVLLFGGCTSIQKQSLQLKLDTNWARETTLKEYVGPKLVGLAEPVVSDGIVYQGNPHDGVVALTEDSGTLLWRFNVKNGVTSGVAVNKSYIYFSGNDGQFYALKKNSGAVAWTYPTQAESLSKPVISDSRVYFLSGNGSLIALDTESGKIIWSYFQRDNSNLNIRSASSPQISDGLIYIGFNDGTIVCLDKNSGYLKWERNLSTPKEKFRDADATPVIDGENLFIATYDGGLYSLKKLSGEINWKFEKGSSNKPLIHNNTLYYSTNEGTLIALDKVSGKELWSYKLKQGIASTAQYHKELLVFGTSGRSLEIISTQGQPVSSYNVGWGVSAPAYINENGNIIFTSNYGNIYSLNMKWIRPIQEWPWEKL